MTRVSLTQIKTFFESKVRLWKYDPSQMTSSDLDLAFPVQLKPSQSQNKPKFQVKIWFQNRRMKWKRERRGEEFSDDQLDSRLVDAPDVSTAWNHNQFFFP